MGMDIYFQPFRVDGTEAGDLVNLRCRDIYHTMNDWRVAQEAATPESGEHVVLTQSAWAQLKEPVRQAIMTLDREIEGALTGKYDEVDSAQNAQAWLNQIWPAGTDYVEYWFTV